MPKRASQAPAEKTRDNTSDNLALEDKLWQTADAMRNMCMDKHKHDVSGLISLKYFSDTFEAKHAELTTATTQGAGPAPSITPAAESTPTTGTAETEDV